MNPFNQPSEINRQCPEAPTLREWCMVIVGTVAIFGSLIGFLITG